MDAKCLFCRIVSGEIPADIVAETDDAIVFRDISPKAPAHLLVIPRRHVPSLADAGEDVDLEGLLRLAAKVAVDEGLADAGYRVVINTREQGGQTVHHLHLHLLGGRQMHWPPG